MIVAAHIHPAENRNTTYLLGLLHALINDDHQYIFFIEKKHRPNLHLSSNAVVHEISPSIKNGLWLRYWYLFKLPSLLKKYNADVFLSEFPALAEKGIIPKGIFISDPNFATRNGFRNYYRSVFKKKIKNTHQLFVAGEHIAAPVKNIEKEIIQPIVEPVFTAKTHEQKEETKTTYTNGKEYFISEITDQNIHLLVSLLKGFSQFKKWQKSAFALVLLAEDKIRMDVEKILKGYKYADEIFIFDSNDLPVNAALTAACFAAISVTGNNLFTLFARRVIASKAALLISDSRDAKKLFGEFAIYFEENDKALMQAMLTAYKSEYFVKQMIAGASHLQEQHNGLPLLAKFLNNVQKA